jgi:DNA-binding IclR family transcriptional regulator
MKAESTVVESVSVDDAVRRRAEAEYREMPGLKLTLQQASRLWHLDPAASARLLDSMVEAGVLYRAKDGGYVLLFAR